MRRSPVISNLGYIPIPPEIKEIGSKVVLEADIIYVNTCMFGFMMSQKLNF